MRTVVKISYALVEQVLRTGAVIPETRIVQGIAAEHRLIGAAANGHAIVLVFDDGQPSPEGSEAELDVRCERGSEEHSHA